MGSESERRRLIINSEADATLATPAPLHSINLWSRRPGLRTGRSRPSFRGHLRSFVRYAGPSALGTPASSMRYILGLARTQAGRGANRKLPLMIRYYNFTYHLTPPYRPLGLFGKLSLPPMLIYNIAPPQSRHRQRNQRVAGKCLRKAA